MRMDETVVLDIASGEVAPERFIRANVSKPDEVDEPKDEVVKRYGRVDILVDLGYTRYLE
jgi:NAD(P)-dependent dehydrogenase (short-subunit alcohol dehydrogenase family)